MSTQVAIIEHRISFARENHCKAAKIRPDHVCHDICEQLFTAHRATCSCGWTEKSDAFRIAQGRAERHVEGILR